MSRTKLSYAEEIRNAVYGNLINRDTRLDLREVMLVMDKVVNELARKSFFDNWDFGHNIMDNDLFTTTWDGANAITVTDPINANSFFTLPGTYVDLPKQQGLASVYFINDPTVVTKKYFYPIVIKNFNDQYSYRSSMAANNQGRISGYVKNGQFIFDRGNINKVYGQVGVRLVLRDSSAISDTAPYPIPADAEATVLTRCVEFFRQRRQIQPDLIRDADDKS